jgi:outer membrane protein, heavy metal efflux system
MSNRFSCNVKLLALSNILATFILTGCATYHEESLPEQSVLQKDLNILTVDANKFLKSRQGTHEINIADGLDMTEVAIIAVLENPNLKVQRTQYEVAEAQVFSAGLLPDPKLSTILEKPTGDSTGLVNAWGVDLSYDIIPLITRQARINNEKGLRQKIQLELLWQEWQVVQQARSLVVSYKLEEQQLALLHTMQLLYQERYQQSVKGMSQGNITLDVNGTDLTALIDTFSQITQIEQQHNETSHALNQLLGLALNADITLSKLPAEIPFDRTEIHAQLNRLADVRPDMLALKAGYQAQEEKVRAAILGQFPSFSIGITRVRDTGGIYASGFTIGLTLPLFSGNRGNIAIERATRKQLSQEYTARLLQAQNDVSRLLELQSIIEKQQINLNTYLPRLEGLVERARKAYARGDIDALTFLNMESTWVNKRLEQISLQKTQWQNRIALQALLALPDSLPELVKPEPAMSRLK